MRICLHIGTEKTGSTSIQNFLSRFSAYYRERQIAPGFLIEPQFGKNSVPLVIASDPDPGLSLKVHRKSSFRSYRKKLKNLMSDSLNIAEKRGFTKVIFSAEQMSSRLVLPEHIHNLKTLFEPQHQLEIACYLRRQDQMLLGAQAEGIKFGNPDLEVSIPNLDEEMVKYGISYYDHSLMLDRWEKVFGIENMVVAAFQKSELIQANVIADFSQRMLGIEVDQDLLDSMGGDPQFQANKRLSGEALFVLAKLNESPNANPKANREFVKQLDPGTNSALIRPPILLEFYQQFELSNRKVANKYFGRSELFDPPEHFPPYCDYSSHANQVEVLLQFLGKCVK